MPASFRCQPTAPGLVELKLRRLAGKIDEIINIDIVGKKGVTSNVWTLQR